MNTELVIEIGLAVLLVVWIAYRQFTWRPVRVGRVWLLPGILAVVGIAQFARTPDLVVTPLDLVLLAIEAVVGVGIGIAMGALARFRVADIEADAAPGSAPGRTVRGLESRTGWIGLVLWLVVIGLRIGLGVWGAHDGAVLVESPAVILISLALNRGARAVVLDLRARRRLEALAA